MGTHVSIQEGIITRGNVSASMFAYGITSSNKLEQLIQDILLNTEALGDALVVTAANVNISSHASLRHESWAICHGADTNGLLCVQRSSAEAHTGDTERAAIGIPGQLSRRTARLQQHSRPAMLGSGLALPEAWSPSSVDALAPDHQREESTWNVWKSKVSAPAPAWNF